MKTNKIIISGFGGQGILFAGKILAEAALLKGKELSWLPSYGPEMRGGTANCHVIISDEKVGSPIIMAPDILIAMNQPSLEKFEMTVSAGGKLFIDSSLIQRRSERSDAEACYIPATQLAVENGHGNLANMVMLGALLRHTEIFTLDEIRAAVDMALPQKRKNLLDVDMGAVMTGYNFT